MAISARAVVRLKLPSEKELIAIFAALTPEVSMPAARRAIVKLEKDKLFLVVTIEAEDTVALRSTLNAYLRWINSTINTLSLIEQI